MPAFDGTLEAEFAAIRRLAGVPESFPDGVIAASAESVRTGRARLTRATESERERVDARALPLITIDPPGSRDLDQAFYAERTHGGYAVYYAIADVGAFVPPGSPVDDEAWNRGLTFYSPDARVPLYPTSLSEDAASLLPDGDRPAILFGFDLDPQARARLRTVESAIVRNHRQLAYGEVSDHLRVERERPGQGSLAGQAWSEALSLLEEIGRKRQARARERGASSLPISAQHVRRWEAALHGYWLAFEDPNDVEGWNAEISLMTGMGAAACMGRRRAGLLRVLDPPRTERVVALRLTAETLDVAWPAGADYSSFIDSLDPTNPVHAAVIYHAAGTMRGARYVAFEGAPPLEARHAAIAAFYAHTTAPLRRLADRYVLDLLVRQCAGLEVDASLLDALRRLPAVMDFAERRAREAETEVVELAEAVLLADRVGEVFDALVIRIRTDRITVQIAEPPVRADIATERLAAAGSGQALVVSNGSAMAFGANRVALGEHIRVRLVAAEPRERRVSFVPEVATAASEA
jgi:exoribonuclease R